uniref:Uncharacterized protein n=1 Tax=Cannabis sativa TaxID=3483 RepID=A0A803Q580_CANSA
MTMGPLVDEQQVAILLGKFTKDEGEFKSVYYLLQGLKLFSNSSGLQPKWLYIVIRFTRSSLPRSVRKVVATQIRLQGRCHAKFVLKAVVVEIRSQGRLHQPT